METIKVKQIEKHSLHMLFLLGIFLVLGSWGLGVLIQKNALIKLFDGYFYDLIANKQHAPWLDALIRPFDLWFFPYPLRVVLFFPAYFYFLLGAFFVYMAIFKRKMLFWAVVTIVIGAILVGTLLSFHWHVVFRERPFETLPNSLPEETKNALRHWPSFPSGHTRDTAMFSTIIAAFVPYSGPFLALFSAFIAYSRVYTGAHFPTDVIGGLLIGFLTGRVSLMMVRELQILLTNYKMKTHGTKPKE